VGARALVAPSATVEDGATLDALGMLGPGETVPAGERWGGSPARRLDEHDADLTLLRACKTQGVTTDPKRLPYALAAAGIMALPLVAGLPELPLVLWGYERMGGLGLLLVVPPSAILFVLALSLLLAAVKRLLPPVRPGVVPLGSAARLRHWVVDRLLLTEMDNVPNLFGALYAAPWLRLLGAKIGARIGKRVYLESLDITEFDLVDIGNEAALGHACTIQTHLFEDRIMKMDRLTIGDRCVVGAHAAVLYGTELGAGAEIGPLSLMMKGESFGPATRWAGIPARHR